MTQSTQEAKATGTQLLEQILEQISLQNDQLDGISARLDHLIEAVRSDNQTNGDSPASNQASSSNGRIIEFDAEELVMLMDNHGQSSYRIKGGMYPAYGLRVWPEVLPELGIDPDTLKFGSNPFRKRVCAHVGVQGKQKVIGLASQNGGKS